MSVVHSPSLFPVAVLIGGVCFPGIIVGSFSCCAAFGSQRLSLDLCVCVCVHDGFGLFLWMTAPSGFLETRGFFLTAAAGDLHRSSCWKMAVKWEAMRDPSVGESDSVSSYSFNS